MKKPVKNLITRVSIRGNSVLVPVKVAFGPIEKTAMLLLDTGAEIVVLHKDFADQLNIRSFKKSQATLAGGKTIPVGISKLAYVHVGPHKRKDMLAAIITPARQMGYHGLLGMNFLRNLNYRIDFDNQVIVWQP